MTPKISFVIPVYDGDSYLAETIESIRKQTMKDIEILVIDDASPDFTEELMNYYIHLDDRIKYHRFEHNVGVCESRNFGNKTAMADLICVSDQDDLSDPRRAIYSFGFMEKHQDIDCLTSYYYECNVDAVRINKHEAPQMTREVFDAGSFTWFHSSACYRKKDALEIPYRAVDGATDDWVFLDDWTRAGKKFHTTKTVLGYCRRLPWGVMQHRRQMQGMEPSYIL